MGNLFEPADRGSILARLASLSPDAERQWGKMACGQALAHCSVVLEAATGDRPRKQGLFGKLLSPIFRKKILGEQPFGRNSPTDPAFVIRDDRNFEAERRRLTDLVNRFCALGPEKVAVQAHSFLGRLTGEEWGRMMYKHLDHHLRQFGA